MRYIKFTSETPYAGTTETEYVAFPDNTPDEFLTEWAEDSARNNAETYSYLATGWTSDEGEEMENALDDYYNSCYGYWEEVDCEEWEENGGYEN